MVRLISRQRGGLAALKLTKLFGIDDFPAAKDSGKVLIIIIYCYLIIISSCLEKLITKKERQKKLTRFIFSRRFEFIVTPLSSDKYL